MFSNVSTYIYSIKYDLCHVAVHVTAVESRLGKLAETLRTGHGNLIGEVKADVYSLSGLGQMHGVRGLHRRLPSQVF